MPVWPDPKTPALHLSLLQFAPRLADEPANVAAISALLQQGPTDLAVTPELSLTGYDLRDGVPDLAHSTWPGYRFPHPTLVGAIESASGLVYNVAALAHRDQTSVVHRKLYLPTYGMFDEARYFGSGDRVQPFEIQGWRIGVLICEDFWHPALAYLHAIQGIHALVVMAAAPGRGALAGGEAGAFFASSDAWERIARTTAQLYGIFVIVCNRVGVEGGVTFAGESLVVAPNADVVARGGVEPERLDVMLPASDLVRGRRPGAHLRDEDPRLLLAELQRIDADARS
jgi:predicted amidohydrolase